MARKYQAVKCHSHKPDGSPCGAWAMRGQKVCGAHGGRSPQAKRAAAARLSEAQALTFLARMDVPVMTDPLTAMGELAGLAMALVQVAREQLAELKSMAGLDHLGDERIRVHVQLLGQFMDRAQRFAAELARLNLDERIAGMHALVLVRQGELMAGLVRAILARLGLTAGQWELVGQVVPEEFRALEERRDAG